MPAGERQFVEIAKAIGADARVIILDEPTTSLSARKCERLFALLNQFRERGIAMIYISHALSDALRLCDDPVVLRDGEGVGGGLGLLTTPLAVLTFGSKNAIGIILPLLCAGDAFSLWNYWGKWRAENLKMPFFCIDQTHRLARVCPRRAHHPHTLLLARSFFRSCP